MFGVGLVVDVVIFVYLVGVAVVVIVVLGRFVLFVEVFIAFVV